MTTTFWIRFLSVSAMAFVQSSVFAQGDVRTDEDPKFTICSSHAYLGQTMLEQSNSEQISLYATEGFSDLGAFNRALAEVLVSHEGAEQVVEVANTLSKEITDVFQANQPHMSAELAGKYYFLMCYDEKPYEFILNGAKFLAPEIGRNCENKSQQDTWACFESVSQKASATIEEIAREYGIYDELQEGANEVWCKHHPDSSECSSSTPE